MSEGFSVWAIVMLSCARRQSASMPRTTNGVPQRTRTLINLGRHQNTNTPANPDRLRVCSFRPFVLSVVSQFDRGEKNFSVQRTHGGKPTPRAKLLRQAATGSF